MIQGLSVRAAAREVGISTNTYFEWRHRIISVHAGADSHTRLEGIIKLAQKSLIISADGSRVSLGSPARTVGRDRPWLNPLYPGPDYNRHKRFLLFAVDRRERVRAEIIEPYGSNTPGQAISWVDGVGSRGLKADPYPQDRLYHVANARSLMMALRNWTRRFQVLRR